MNTRKPPSQGMCLWLAQMYWEMKPRTKAQEQRSWHYLVMWAFYEMFLEEWKEMQKPPRLHTIKTWS